MRPERTRGGRGGWFGSVEGVVVPVGVEPDEVEGDRGEHVLQARFSQAAVAGVSGAGGGEGLVDVARLPHSGHRTL